MLPPRTRRDLASISPTHARIDSVLNQLEQIVPPEARDNPLVRMFLTFMKEGRKDIARMPEEYVVMLARPIGQAFTWVADGGSLENDLFTEPSDLIGE